MRYGMRSPSNGYTKCRIVGETDVASKWCGHFKQAVFSGASDKCWQRAPENATTTISVDHVCIFEGSILLAFS